MVLFGSRKNPRHKEVSYCGMYSCYNLLRITNVKTSPVASIHGSSAKSIVGAGSLAVKQGRGLVVGMEVLG